MPGSGPQRKIAPVGVGCFPRATVHQHTPGASAGGGGSMHTDIALLRAQQYALVRELEMIIAGWRDIESSVRRLTPWERERMEFAQEVVEDSKD